MDFVKISVETYTNKKMEIEQLAVVLRIVSIGRAETGKLHEGLSLKFLYISLFLSIVITKSN